MKCCEEERDSQNNVGCDQKRIDDSCHHPDSYNLLGKRLLQSKKKKQRRRHAYSSDESDSCDDDDEYEQRGPGVHNLGQSSSNFISHFGCFLPLHSEYC